MKPTIPKFFRLLLAVLLAGALSAQAAGKIHVIASIPELESLREFVQFDPSNASAIGLLAIAQRRPKARASRPVGPPS